MHGTVGPTPAANEVIMSLTPGAHGENMDTPEIRSGTTVYFGVNVSGGLVAMGDGDPKRSQGILATHLATRAEARGPLASARGPLTCYFVVAGAGFEPATSGL